MARLYVRDTGVQLPFFANLNGFALRVCNEQYSMVAIFSFHSGACIKTVSERKILKLATMLANLF